MGRASSAASRAGGAPAAAILPPSHPSRGACLLRERTAVLSARLGALLPLLGVVVCWGCVGRCVDGRVLGALRETPCAPSRMDGCCGGDPALHCARGGARARRACNCCWANARGTFVLRLARRDLATQARPSGTDAFARCTPHSQTSGPKTMIRAELASAARAKSDDRRCVTQQCNRDASARTLAGGDLAGKDGPRCHEGEGGRARPSQCTPAAPLRTVDARGSRTRLGDATCRHMPSLSMPAAIQARSFLSLAHVSLQPQHGHVPHLSPSPREVGRSTLPPVPSCGGHPGVGAQPAPASSHGVAGGIPSPGRGLDPPRLGPGGRAAALARSGTGPQPQPQPQPLPRQPLHEPPAWISRSRAWSTQEKAKAALQHAEMGADGAGARTQGTAEADPKADEDVVPAKVAARRWAKMEATPPGSWKRSPGRPPKRQLPASSTCTEVRPGSRKSF